MARVSTWVPIAALLLCNLCNCETRKAEPTATPQTGAQAVVAAGKPVLNDWFALGSGCRAKFDLPGDVTLAAAPPDPAQPGIHRVRFLLKELTLDTATEPGGTSLKFARECAIRLNINPPPGMRLKSLAARARVTSTKGPGVELVLNGELKLGSLSLDHTLATYPRGVGHVAKEEAYDFQASGPAFSALQCAEPKIIGFDLTWIADRASRGDAALVSVAGDRTLEIEARLEPCP